MIFTGTWDADFQVCTIARLDDVYNAIKDGKLVIFHIPPVQGANGIDEFYANVLSCVDTVDEQEYDGQTITIHSYAYHAEMPVGFDGYFDYTQVGEPIPDDVESLIEYAAYYTK